MILEKKIVGVAIVWKGVLHTMPAPMRHGHIIQAMARLYPGAGPFTGEQGFVFGDGTFARRRAAERIARYQKQLTKPLIGSVLTSEDLW